MGRRGHDRAPAGKAGGRCGGTFVCIASGPSLAQWQTDHLRDKAATAIAINTSFRRLVRPGIVYGCDGVWWDRYAADVAEARHQGWTQDKDAAARYGLNRVQARAGIGLCFEPGVVHTGANSGYQAINLAFHMGAERILLIGYDMQFTGGRSHWHGDHPRGLNNAGGIARWAKNFPPLADDLAEEGIEVLNCSIETALTCFPRADLREVL